MRGSLEELPNVETDLHGSLACFFTNLVKLWVDYAAGITVGLQRQEGMAEP